MMIQCKTHGYKYGIQISPDISEAIESGGALPSFREINYEYDGKPYIRMLVSSNFAIANHISDESMLDLPDQYPSWHDDMVIVCEECISNALQKLG